MKTYTELKEEIKLKARMLRKNQTPAEKLFWQHARKRQIAGKKFLRQYPIKFELDGDLHFVIADFYCSERKLIVEIDGGIHETQKDYDELKTQVLTNLGYQVFRFSNKEVLKDITRVVSKLKEILDKNWVIKK